MKAVRFTVGNDDFSRINFVTVTMDQIESFRYKMGSIISPMMQTFRRGDEDATKLKRKHSRMSSSSRFKSLELVMRTCTFTF